MPKRAERTILRIQGTLHRVGDSVYIPDLKCNGTILRFSTHYVVIQPHDYGATVRRLSKNLRIGYGINSFIRETLELKGIYTRDTAIVRRGTFQIPSRKTYVEPYFCSPL